MSDLPAFNEDMGKVAAQVGLKWDPPKEIEDQYEVWDFANTMLRIYANHVRFDHKFPLSSDEQDEIIKPTTVVTFHNKKPAPDVQRSCDQAEAIFRAAWSQLTTRAVSLFWILRWFDEQKKAE